MEKAGITIFTKLFWPEGGGAELATYLIAKNILSKHFNVTIVSGTNNPVHDVINCCRYLHWPILKTRYKPIEWLKLIANTHHMRKLIEDTDIIYIPSHTLLPLTIVAKSIKPSIKVVLHLHNYQPLTYTSVVLANRGPSLVADVIVEYGEHGNLLRALASGIGHYVNVVNRLALYYADKVICVSRRQYEILARYVPEIRDRAVVIYNPPPPVPNIDKEPSEEPSILYSGGGSFIKGFHIAINALAKVMPKHNLKAYVIRGHEAPKHLGNILKILTKRFRDKFTVLERLRHDEYMMLHKHVWAMLFPSISEEPLPYAVIESMLAGTIPIASKIGGIPEIVKGTYAEKMIFEPGNIDELVERIEEVASLSKEQLQNIGEDLRKTVIRRFDINSIQRQLLNVYYDNLS